MSLLEVHDVDKSFTSDGGVVPVLRGVRLAVPAGQMHAITGPSGSGKSTLLRILACLDAPDAGRVLLGGEPLPEPWSAGGDRHRNRRCGIVLQDFALMEHATALENVMLPLRYGPRRLPRAEQRRRAAEALEGVGLGPRSGHRARTLSGGEKQRVAVARALINDPPLVLADEPTGALDQARSREVVDLLRAAVGPERAVVVVTHDPRVAAACDRRWHLEDGRLLGED
ncbi:ABC transporter ATP-binding protein [Micrococcus sp.]|uniref:ABC transporter ATP-binding protein n=1 Tax=Micrococcus sp. TaxID=1271 RepID=UPI002A911240|nr:ABC transporter ATP-binding protein [Micrococcus sp.]MDY6054937.1 ABC transporter ATP-binding protein [Micrococcus sp.]